MVMAAVNSRNLTFFAGQFQKPGPYVFLRRAPQTAFKIKRLFPVKFWASRSHTEFRPKDARQGPGKDIHRSFLLLSVHSTLESRAGLRLLVFAETNLLCCRRAWKSCRSKKTVQKVFQIRPISISIHLLGLP